MKTNMRKWGKKRRGGEEEEEEEEEWEERVWDEEKEWRGNKAKDYIWSLQW